MLLMGFESGPGRLTGGAQPGALYINFFSITPLRAGRVWFRLSQYYSIEYVRMLEREVENVRRQYGEDHAVRLWCQLIPGQGAVFAPDTCGSFVFGTWGADPALCVPWDRFIGACAIPIKWEDMPEPQTLLAPIGTCRSSLMGIHAGLMGPLPKLQFFKEPPSLLRAKPGDAIEVPFEVGFPQIGGSVDLSSTNMTTGRSGSGRFTFNPGERVTAVSRDTMSALNPDESLSMETVFTVSICDIRNLTRTEEGANRILDLLKPSLEPIKRLTKIEPTDCILVDTEKGIAQILGDNLEYEGVMVSEALPPVRPLKGTAPTKLDTKGVKFLRLDFSREIALCENRSLISGSSARYEYSTFPTLFMVGQRVKSTLTKLAPQPPWEGAPLPGFMAGPRITGGVVKAVR